MARRKLPKGVCRGKKGRFVSCARKRAGRKARRKRHK